MSAERKVTDCSCPDELLYERSVRIPIPVKDGRDSWSRINPRPYEMVPGVKHAFIWKGQQVGVIHRLDGDG